MFPIDLARLGVEDIVDESARIAWPGIERQEGMNSLQLLKLLRPRTEIGPYCDHQMSVVAMHIIDHFFGIFQSRLCLCLHVLHVYGKVFSPCGVSYFVDIIRILKAHRIPVGVAAPVLPVLDHGIDRDLQFTVFVENTGKLVTCLIALAALPEAHRPQWKHRGLACQRADTGDDSVLSAVLVDEIIVGCGTGLTREGGASFVVVEIALSGVVPIDAISFLACEIRDRGIRVVVPDLHMSSALVHMSIAKLTEAVDSLVFVQ